MFYGKPATFPAKTHVPKLLAGKMLQAEHIIKMWTLEGPKVPKTIKGEGSTIEIIHPIHHPRVPRVAA